MTAINRGNARLSPAQAAPLRADLRRRRHLSWLQALALVAGVSATAVTAGSVLVTRTDPQRFPDLWVALWWAASTVTTVGYGDVVPATAAGRAIGVVLMFVGIGSIAFLTAVAASAIVVGEVSAEEQRIESEEREIENVQESIFVRLVDIDTRLRRIETTTRARRGQRRRSQNSPPRLKSP